ncbi:hypothetical protein AKJ09_09862 [Labilithrix luteola]|uniref:Uncharacterized protein n=2 Tax=Labilithrix luteola TaxID=1391654 RepID=A0A0K1QBS0_9BACT|nr:hypothetical protein AKJ09_09862 [Labilithrix luteola]
MNLRDYLSEYVPSWLADDGPESPSYGFRFLWSVALLVDAAVDVAMQGQLAAVTRGTPTALPLIADERGIRRGQEESEESWAERLRGWIARWKDAGSDRAVARGVHEYLKDHPRVRVISRSGLFVTMNADGSITTKQSSWDWDSVSYPERASWDWESWVVIYTDQFPHCPAWGEDGDVWGGDEGFGQDVPRVVVDDIFADIAQWKSAHQRVRTVIVTTDPTRFDPDNPASLPDGTWGHWIGNRDLETCRYWETNEP